MSVTIKDVENVAALARLSFTEEEKTRLMGILNNILAYFGKISELDTSDVEPLNHILPVENVMRPDTLVPSLSQEKALENAPEHTDGHFVIPKVLE